jgi:hypothetical protein
MYGKKKMLALIAFLTLVSYAIAQSGFGDDVDDTAPIPGLLIAAIVGLVIGVRKTYPEK